MTEITFLGNAIHTVGSVLQAGEQVPNFELTRNDMTDVNLETYKGMVKIFNIFLSIDTPVCATSVKEFNKRATQHENIIVLNISADLPFAGSRFCAAEGLERVETLSTFRSSFPDDYGIRIAEGPLKGLCSRAVIIVSKDNQVLYSEQVSELSQQPDYDLALKAIQAIKE